jgi:hypothetical protein
VVRKSAVVKQSLRQKFDQWYSSDHLPRDLAAFKAEKAWRFWSAANASVHYARLSVRRHDEARCGDER